MLSWLASKLDLGYRIYDRARHQIDEEEYAKALWWARILRRLRFSGAYEVEALVYREQGKLAEAALSLEEGLRLAPGVWLLHNLLGSTYSDQGRYEEALECYRLAGRCQGAEPDFVLYNQSVVLRRQGDLNGALELCPQESDDPGLNARIRGARLELLEQLGRTDEVLQLAESCLTGDESNQPDASQVHLIVAKSLQERDPQRALQQAIQCLKKDMRRNHEAQTLIESLLPESPTIRFAFWFEGTTRRGFFVILVQVVAETEEQALDIYCGAQSEELRALPLKKSENRGRFPADQRGIFFGPVHLSTGPPTLWERILGFFRDD